MKLRYLTYAGGLAALTGAAMVASQGWDVDLATDAEAANATSLVTINCTAPTVTAFTPGVTYTLSFTAPAAATIASAADASTTAALTGAVNSDAAPTMTTAAGTGSSHLTIYSAAPKIKLGGIACSALTQSQLQAYATAAAATFDTALQVVTSTTYNGSNKLDGATAAAPLMEFGTAGIGGTALITDTADASGTQNGEIVMGTGAPATSGGLRLFGDVTYLGANPNAANETITLVFTAS